MQHVPGAGSVGGRPKSRDAYRYRSSPHSARACVFARVFARVFACVCACADILRDSLLYVCSCLWMWTAACAYTHAPPLTYACVHTHTHTQTHTWIYVWALPTQARMQRCAAHSPPARALESARAPSRARAAGRRVASARPWLRLRRSPACASPRRARRGLRCCPLPTRRRSAPPQCASWPCTHARKPT